MDCWLWTGHKNEAGYGRPRIQGKQQYLHRFVWTFINGPISKGMCVLHSCDVRNCFNPDHLFLGTQSENVADMDRKGRRNSGVTNRLKTHCKNGHEYTPENTRVSMRGNSIRRRCVACIKYWNDIANAKAKELRRASY